ncbi:hypothetical protein BVRB_1g005000 [Beta vulgaris subsp. vulgaris]|nr:hypothetical protein BVRB_1g005000 [Beta vulgaris subsp. vulgaris]
MSNLPLHRSPCTYNATLIRLEAIVAEHRYYYSSLTMRMMILLGNFLGGPGYAL